MKTADELLIELDSLLKCTHVDMGGNHKYMVTHATQPVLREIKEYVRKINDDLDYPCNCPAVEGCLEYDGAGGCALNRH